MPKESHQLSDSSSSSSSSEEFHDCLNSLDLSDPEQDNLQSIQETTTTTTTREGGEGEGVRRRRRGSTTQESTNSSPTVQLNSTPPDSRFLPAGTSSASECAKMSAELKHEEEHSRSSEESSLDEAAGDQIQSSQKEFDDEFDEESMRLNEATLSTAELEANRDKALAMKEEANALFRAEKTQEAIEMYTNALKINPLKYSKERAILYGNRAAAKIQFDARKSALDDCTKALELWPEYVRVILRRAKLYEQEDKLDEALEDYKRVYELDAGQVDARQAIVRLPPLINERNERLKDEMLGKLKDLGNMFLRPLGLSTNNFQMEQNPETGSYSLSFKQNSS